MYLPLGSTLLRALQLPLFFNYDQLAAPAVVSDEQVGLNTIRDFNNLGNLAPYHSVPHVHAVSQKLPNDCVVDQVILLHRHGSRGPGGEKKMIDHLVGTLEKHKEKIQATHLPEKLKFLRDGYKSHLVSEKLTVVGRQQLFDHGTQFALRYPGFSTNYVLSTKVERVVDSALFFALGFFGFDVKDITLETTDKVAVPAWTTPWSSCPKINDTFSAARKAVQTWANIYQPEILERLDLFLPRVFDIKAIAGALYACVYDLAAGRGSDWCNVFTEDELKDLEYAQDLYLDTISGYASRHDRGPLLGAFYIQKLIERLTNSTGNAERLYLEFAHDFTIAMALSTLGLNKDATPLEPTTCSEHRKFRSSHQSPFAAQMIWEKFTCRESFQGPQVRLVLNDATFPLTTCQTSEKDKEYGTCSVAKFKEVNKGSEDVRYKSDDWNAACET